MMEIVIDIEQELYEEILSRKYSKTRIEKAVANGTPLPKGHGRLIDADTFGKELHRYTEAPYQYALKVFNDAPTIIEADKIFMVTDATLAQAIRKYQDNFRNPDTKNNKLEKAKEIIKKNFRYGGCGLFNSRNIFGDPMHNIYNADGLKIDICFRYGYFEVFGLNNEEFKELNDYYIKLGFESE